MYHGGERQSERRRRIGKFGSHKEMEVNLLELWYHESVGERNYCKLYFGVSLCIFYVSDVGHHGTGHFGSSKSRRFR